MVLYTLLTPLTNRCLLVVLVLFSSVYFLHYNMFNTAKSNALLVCMGF